MAKVRRDDPYLDSGMEGFIRNTAIREFWRVADWYDDPDDLIQDGYMCFCKCRAAYVGEGKPLPASHPTDEHRRHMMSLVKTTFWRHIRFTIAGKMQWGHEEPVSQLVRTGSEAPADPWEGLTPPAGDVASLLAVLCSLPSELQELVVLLAGDGAETLGFRCDRLARRHLPSGHVRVVRRGRRRLRETTNTYYCRLLNLDPTKHDLVGQLRALLTS
jgi:hypothetical protein